MSTINQIGTRIDINARAGVTLGIFEVTVVDLYNAPVDLTGVVPQGAIYDSRGKTKVIDWTFDTEDLADGIIRFSVAAEDTTDLTTCSINHAAKYTWVMNLAFPGDLVVPAYYGDLRLIAGDGQ